MKDDAPLTRQRAPWHLWLVGILGLLWNSVGAFDYFMTQAQDESYMGQFTPDQLESTSLAFVTLIFFVALGLWLYARAIGALGVLR